MNKKYARLLAALILLNSLVTCALASADVPRMSKEDLKSRLGDANIVIIDVRIGADWEQSDSKIKGAVRESPQDVAAWVKKYTKEKTIVLYCA
jgi:rhodanese-related sulfurtransferase